MRQLALPFVHRAAFPVDGFLAAPSNEAALGFLSRDAWRTWPLHRLALHGPAGSGKTHLLHLWVGGLREAGRDAALVEAAAIRSLPAHAALPAAGGIAVDDADTIGDERALLHLMNRAAEDGVPLVLAARSPPARWPVALPDLASRLRATLAAAIAAPEDALLDALFARLLADRQLAAAEPVARFLRLRLPREGAAIRDAVARLDRLALERGRPVTLALAQRLLAELDIASDAQG